MAFRRRASPYAQERERMQSRESARSAKDRPRYDRLMRGYKNVALTGDEAQRAWGLKEVRSLYPNGDNSRVIVRSDGKHLYLQVQGAVGQMFYRLEKKTRKRKKRLRRLGGGPVLRRRPS